MVTASIDNSGIGTNLIDATVTDMSSQTSITMEAYKSQCRGHVPVTSFFCSTVQIIICCAQCLLEVPDSKGLAPIDIVQCLFESPANTLTSHLSIIASPYPVTYDKEELLFRRNVYIR